MGIDVLGFNVMLYVDDVLVLILIFRFGFVGELNVVVIRCGDCFVGVL